MHLWCHWMDVASGESVLVLPGVIKISDNNSYAYNEGNTQGRRPVSPFFGLGIGCPLDNGGCISGPTPVMVQWNWIQVQYFFRSAHNYDLILSLRFFLACLTVNPSQQWAQLRLIFCNVMFVNPDKDKVFKLVVKATQFLLKHISAKGVNGL